MSRHLFKLGLLLLSVNLYSQLSYYVTDSSSFYGVEILDQTSAYNAIECKVIQSKKDTLVFTPYDIKEYYLGPERLKFYSREYDFNGEIKRYFFQKLGNGTLDIYYLKSYEYTGFFYEEEGRLIKLPEVDSAGVSFKKKLTSITPQVNSYKEISRILLYNKSSLTRYVKRYDRGSKHAIPTLYTSIYAGFGNHQRYITTIGQNDFTVTSPISPFLGYAVGIPISGEQVVFQPSLIYLYEKAYYHMESTVLIHDAYISASTLRLPLTIALSTPTRGFKAYIEGGVVPGMIINHTTQYVISRNTNNLIEVDYSISEDILEKYNLGYIGGVGIEKKTSLSRSIFLGLKYESSFKGSNHAYKAVYIVSGLKY